MEIFVEIQENVRGSDVFIIQSTSFPANDHLMELLIITDALRRVVGAPHHRGDSRISATPGRTARPARARRSRPSWSPI